MASETTAAQAGAVGVIRRDPMAMRPFCGYDIGLYLQHWLDVGVKLGKNAPQIFHVNCFRTSPDGKFLWPGFGENLRVLKWVIERCKAKGTAVETPIGTLPTPDAIDTRGLDLPKENLQALLEVDRSQWQQEVADQERFFKQLAATMPKEIVNERNALAERLRS